MTIAFGSAGTVPTGTGTGTGTTSVTPALPASLADGDLVLIFVGDKPDTSTPTTPSGWTLVATVAGGGGTAGADAGPSRISCFSRVKDASWSTMPSVSITSANGSYAFAVRYTKAAANSWDIASTTGVDTTNATSYSIAGGSNPGITAGDMLVAAGQIATDTTTWATQTLTATGATIGTRTERGEPVTSQGNDVGGCVWDAACTAGTATAAPVAGATLSSNNGAVGPGIIVRLREVASGPTDYPRSASDSAPATDAIADAVTLPRGVADSAVATDATVASVSRAPIPRSASDTAAATDAVTRSTARARATSDAAAATESVARTGSRSRAVGDTAAAADATSRATTRARTGSDTAPATDVTAASTTGQLARSMSDSAAATDAVTRSVARTRTRTDAAPAADVTSRRTGATRTTLEAIPLADLAAAAIAQARTLLEDAPAADTLDSRLSEGGPVTDLQVLSITARTRTVSIAEKERTVTIAEIARTVAIAEQSRTVAMTTRTRPVTITDRSK